MNNVGDELNPDSKFFEARVVVSREEAQALEQWKKESPGLSDAGYDLTRLMIAFFNISLIELREEQGIKVKSTGELESPASSFEKNN